MKIAVTSQGEGLDAAVDPRFGRCAYMVILDTATGEVQSFLNDAVAAAHGAGSGAVQFLSQKGVEAVCTQNVGPNAYSALFALGMRVYEAEGHTVKEVAENLKKGLLRQHSGATASPHGV